MTFIRRLFLVLGVALLCASAVLTIAHLRTPGSQFWVLATSLAPYALAGYVVALLLFLIVRLGASRAVRRIVLVGSLLAIVGAVLHAAWLAPLYAGRHPDGKPDLTVMTLNLHLGQGDANQTVSLAAKSKVDVLVLEEVTPIELTALDAAGLKVLLPNRYGAAGLGARGTVVSSAYPLSGTKQLAVSNNSYEMRVLAPKPFWLVAVHTSQPLVSVATWRNDHAVIGKAVAALKGPRMVVGDFNATLDTAPVKALLDGGLRDAAERADSGFHPTWPTDGQSTFGIPIPWAVVVIDHVLTSEPFAAISTQTVKVADTDHKALIARLTG